MSYDNTNTGAIFTNEKTSDKQPDMKGKINVEGKEYEIAVWLKTSKAGNPFWSLKLQEPREASPQGAAIKSTSEKINDLPF
jgi:uncharacterized protein (DUF736 family)